MKHMEVQTVHLHDDRPKGLYRTTAEWAQHSRLRGEDPVFMEFHTNETFHFTESNGLESPLFPDQVKSLPPAFVAVIREGRVLGEEGSVITPDNRLLWDVSLRMVPEDQHPAFTTTPTRPLIETAETVAVLSFFSSQTYFHWLYDVLARIHLLRLSGIVVDKYVINRNIPSQFQDETLAMLGIPSDKVLFTHPTMNLKAQQLVVASISMHSFLEYASWPFQFIRQELYEKQNIRHTGCDRIYISRFKSDKRKILNEDQVTSLLDEYGFSTVALEELSVAQQIETFSSASVIVAPHGSGLANLAFCSPGTKIIEIFARDYTPVCYWEMSNYLRLDYYSMVENGYHEPNQQHLFELNILVSVDRLKQLLNLAGVSRL
ncbi:glycosyltransferase family 61 protein [Paenibacillus filicis]